MKNKSDIILETKSLRKEFSGFVAVSGVNLKVRRGSIHAIIGPNGAGKTTLINLLTKVHQPTDGTIEFNGRDITGLSSPEIARLGIVRSFQISAIFPELTVLENVRIALQCRRGDSFDFWKPKKTLFRMNDEARGYLESVGLDDSLNSMAGDLPYGRRRALEIATTLAMEPELLLLDEPTAGMGTEDIDRTADLIQRCAKDRTIIMVEHNLGVVARLADTISVQVRGQVVAEGNYETVSADPLVKEAYLGAAHA
ncbi:MAG: ABC transporter ATP-binding protein [Tepidamorphaceae bacterium]